MQAAPAARTYAAVGCAPACPTSKCLDACSHEQRAYGRFDSASELFNTSTLAQAETLDQGQIHFWGRPLTVRAPCS